MPTIQKLKHNLAQSEKWGSTFKEEIKKLMEEITQKNGEMARMRKESSNLRDGIQKGESELKTMLDEKLRNAYKKDKLQIKVEEIQARIKVYEEGVRKRMQWNKELKKKLKALEKEIQGQQNITSIDEIFDNFSESSILVDSFCSSKKQSRVSAKSQSGYSMIESSLVRINKLEGDYLGLASKCKKKEDQMERLKKAESRLREKLKLYSSDKENVQASSNKPTSQDNLLQVQELQAKNRDLSQKIESQRAWITNYVKHLEQLLLCEQTGQQIRNTLILLQRQGKKQLKATTSICGYILRDHTNNN